MGRFADIASGKRLSVGISHRCGQNDKSNSALKTFQSAFDPNRTHMAVSGKLKSLNHSLKKRQMKEIDIKNVNLLARIQNQQISPTLDIKRTEKFFKDQMKYQKQMSKSRRKDVSKSIDLRQAYLSNKNLYNSTQRYSTNKFVLRSIDQ